MSSACVIAAAQTVPIRGDVNGNAQQHVRLVDLAADSEAQVVLFPELSLTGYELDLADELAFSQRDSRLAPLMEAAAAHSMIVIAGAPVRLESRLFLAALIIFPDGTVDIYTKHHLGAFSSSDSADGVVPPPEATVFHPGDRNPLVRFGHNTAAIAVCADTGRPSHPEKAAQRGATTYLASMFVIPSDFAKDTANLRTYAGRHSMAVVFANYGGPTGGLPSAGRSAIWSESGQMLAQLEASGAGVVIATEHLTGWRAEALMVGDV